MEIEFWQIAVLTIYAFISINDSLALGIGINYPVFAGCFAGIVMGDMTLGLAVGGTLQFMMLGVAAFGGASVPDYLTGAIIGTVYGVISGKGLEFAIGLAIPVGLLMVQLDIFARLANTVLLHKIDKAIEKLDDKKIPIYVLSGTIFWGLSRALPIFIMLLLGESAVQVVTENLPQWLMGGLSVAGGVLPVVGVGILLRYLPIKNYIEYLILGFFLTAYLQIPMLGVTLVGIVAAIIIKKKSSVSSSSGECVGTVSDCGLEGGFDGDE
ncbi:MAG: PTS mannose/fructose/sorbose/N-acetylgalactosamine transporter subunit IIC [Clostridium sp.]